MILVNNKPVSTLEETSKAKAWYNAEMNKIAKLGQPIVIKRRQMFRIGSDGKRKKPPLVRIQLRATVRSERGLEMWAYCETYKEKAPGNLELKPNSFTFQSVQTLRPDIDPELVFFFTRCVNLDTHGLYIENLEAEATETNKDEMLALEVQYNIMKLMALEDVRYYAKSWGIVNADAITEQLLRKTLKDTVDRSEQNKLATKRGYSEFMGEIEKENPDLTEARAVVNMAFSKGYISYDKLSRRIKHTLSGEYLGTVPIDSKDRMNDYVAEFMLTKRMTEAYNTLRDDVFGVKEVSGVSVADIQMAKTEEELKRIALQIGYKLPAKIGEETLRTRLIEKVQTE